MGEAQHKELYSQQTEQAALGCMFLDEEAAALGCSTLKADDFYVPLYRTIFDAMQKVEKVDFVTVWAELERSGQSERVGFEWLKKVAFSVSTSVNLRHYTEELQRLSYYRRTANAGQALTKAAIQQDQTSIENTLAAITGDGYGSGEIVTLADATEKFISQTAEIRSSGKTIVGLPTGFCDLDHMTGGLRDGDYIILAARPSMGKSALALDIARNVQKKLPENERVVFFSLEMPAVALGNRGYTAEYLTGNDKFSIGRNDADWLRTLQEVEKNSADYENGVGRMLINDDSNMSIEKMRSYCHNCKTKGYHIRLVVVDYLQLMTAKAESRMQEISNISRGLKLLAKDLNCPVLVLSQLSRKNEERGDKRPELSDLRDSGAIEQDADMVMFLYREEYYFPDSEKKNQAELIIRKQRNGPTGTVPLTWIPNCTTFRSFAHFKPTKEEPPKQFGIKD